MRENEVLKIRLMFRLVCERLNCARVSDFGLCMT